MTVYQNIALATAELADRILNNGDEVGSRLGERVLEVIAEQAIIENPRQRYLVSTTRKANVAAQIAETAWVLAGRNDVEWLSHYLPRAKDFSDDGKTWRGGYGPRLQDSLGDVFKLLKEDPTTRRAVVPIYRPEDVAADSKDIPCNTQLQFLSRLGDLHLIVTLRSSDLIWGLSGINAFEWSVLQEIVAAQLGIGVGTMTLNIGSLHVYDRHWSKARAIAENDDSTMAVEGAPYRPSRPLKAELDKFFAAEARIRRGQTFGCLENPMFDEWAHALDYYWNGRKRGGSNQLKAAVDAGPKSRTPQGGGKKFSEMKRDEFQDYVSKLHEEKDAAYKGSWCKRGEQMGIMANIARKVDRLGVDGAGDTAADTAIDLLCYLIKYRLWLEDSSLPEHVERFNERLHDLGFYSDEIQSEEGIRKEFEELEHLVTEGASTLEKLTAVDCLRLGAYALAQKMFFTEKNQDRVWKGYENA